VVAHSVGYGLRVWSLLFDSW